MSDNNVDYLRPFIEATTAAAARFRRVLIVMIIASTLSFVAFWNSRSESWLNARISLAHTAETYVLLKKIGEKLNTNNLAVKSLEGQLNDQKLDKGQRDLLSAESTGRLQEREQLINEKQHLEESYSKNDFDKAERWLGRRRFTNMDQVQSYAQKLESSRIDNVVLIRIPFFGVVLDVNDLGALGGFTFIVILMWFRFSLWREYYNLRSTFKAAKDQDLEFCYKTLAMSQVLTVPPSLDNPQPRERPWGKVVRFLYFLPLSVQLTIFAYDCISFGFGWDISPFNTVVGYSWSLTFLFLSGLLTYWCCRLSSEIDKEWEDTAERLNALRNQVQDSGIA